MKALHKNKIIHRDLKMANILLHGDTLKIADLGFCHLLRNQVFILIYINKDDQEKCGNLGSIGTMAPETLERKPYGLQADMFAVGVILYQMVFSDFPFNSHNDIEFLKAVKTESILKYISYIRPSKI